MFNAIGRKSPFYNTYIMDYSLKSTNDYIKRIIEKNKDKKKQIKINFKIDDLIKENNLIKENEISMEKINILDEKSQEKSSDESKNTNYIPFCLFLSISSFLCIYSFKK